MVRRNVGQIEDAAVAKLSLALGQYRLQALDAERDDEGHLVVQVNSQELVLVVRTVVTHAGAELLVEALKNRRLPVIVVADRIANDGAEALHAAGINTFDLRGRLRLVEPPLVIDVDVAPTRSDGRPVANPLASQVAKEEAIACLLTPDQAHGVREVAAFIDRAPSAASTAMARLRADGLLTSRNEPAVPDLFDELAVQWRNRRVALAGWPDPAAISGPMAARLELGLDSPAEALGWALTETRAASSWGMPVVATGDHPLDFYVPSESAVAGARALYGEADGFDHRACTVAVAPVRLACVRRADHRGRSGERWPVANHIVVALDKARGMEILDGWTPDGIVRAW